MTEEASVAFVEVRIMLYRSSDVSWDELFMLDASGEVQRECIVDLYADEERNLYRLVGYLRDTLVLHLPIRSPTDALDYVASTGTFHQFLNAFHIKQMPNVLTDLSAFLHDDVVAYGFLFPTAESAAAFERILKNCCSKVDRLAQTQQSAVPADIGEAPSRSRSRSVRCGSLASTTADPESAAKPQVRSDQKDASLSNRCPTQDATEPPRLYVASFPGWDALDKASLTATHEDAWEDETVSAVFVEDAVRLDAASSLASSVVVAGPATAEPECTSSSHVTTPESISTSETPRISTAELVPPDDSSLCPPEDEGYTSQPQPQPQPADAVTVQASEDALAQRQDDRTEPEITTADAAAQASPEATEEYEQGDDRQDAETQSAQSDRPNETTDSAGSHSVGDSVAAEPELENVQNAPQNDRAEASSHSSSAQPQQEESQDSSRLQKFKRRMEAFTTGRESVLTVFSDSDVLVLQTGNQKGFVSSSGSPTSRRAHEIVVQEVETSHVDSLREASAMPDPSWMSTLQTIRDGSVLRKVLKPKDSLVFVPLHYLKAPPPKHSANLMSSPAASLNTKTVSDAEIGWRRQRKDIVDSKDGVNDELRTMFYSELEGMRESLLSDFRAELHATRSDLLRLITSRSTAGVS
eukprot:ANDGO_03267.mRNA.1 hypothetical protein